MNDPSRLPDLPELIRQAFRPTERGVVGLVDRLLGLCQEAGLELDWHAGHCRVCPLELGPRQPVEVPLPKSVFRAVLARLAALCNERIPDSVSPFGGEGELSLGADPATVYRLAFTNTQAGPRVRLRCESRRTARKARYHSSR
jgi:hypothetical protein